MTSILVDQRTFIGKIVPMEMPHYTGSRDRCLERKEHSDFLMHGHKGRSIAFCSTARIIDGLPPIYNIDLATVVEEWLSDIISQNIQGALHCHIGAIGCE